MYQIRIGWIRCSGQVLQGESPVIGPGHTKNTSLSWPGNTSSYNEGVCWVEGGLGFAPLAAALT